MHVQVSVVLIVLRQVGLAVDNIKGIRKQAEFKGQVEQVPILIPKSSLVERLFGAGVRGKHQLPIAFCVQVKVLLALMRPFKRLLRYSTKLHLENPREYIKTKGKLHPIMARYSYLKHRVSSLVNFAWKPEDFPSCCSREKDKVRELMCMAFLLLLCLTFACPNYAGSEGEWNKNTRKVRDDR